MPPELDGCVFLHTSNGCESGCDDTGPHAYFTIRLSADALAASAVLEGICGSPGIAKLPEHVTDEDFLLWRNVSPEFPPEPTEDLVRVLKARCRIAHRFWYSNRQCSRDSPLPIYLHARGTRPCGARRILQIYPYP